MPRAAKIKSLAALRRSCRLRLGWGTDSDYNWVKIWAWRWLQDLRDTNTIRQEVHAGPKSAVEGSSTMTSSYLICDLCGRPGPPAAYFFKDGVRMCYGCFLEELENAETENAPDAPVLDDAQDSELDKTGAPSKSGRPGAV
jgi:hypothetical protein